MKKNEPQDQQPKEEAAPPALSYDDVSQARQAAQVLEGLCQKLYVLADALRLQGIDAGDDVVPPGSAFANELAELAGEEGMSMQRHAERLRSLLPAEALQSISL